MKDLERRVSNTCGRVLDFFAKMMGSGVITAPPPTLELLQTTHDSLSNESNKQENGRAMSRQEVSAKDTARLELIQQHLTPLRSAAVGLRNAIPGIVRRLAIPAQRDSQQSFLSQADKFRQAAIEYYDKFIEIGFPSDFVDRLNAAIELVEQTGSRRVAAGGVAHLATKELSGHASECMRVIKLLNAWVLCRLAGNKAAIAFWKRIRRLAKPGEFTQEAQQPQDSQKNVA